MELTFAVVRAPAEIKAIAELAGIIWREHYPSIITHEQIDYMLDRFQSPQAIAEQIEVEGYRYYSVMLGAQRVGYISVKVEDGKLFLSKFYIEKSHRGNGYARIAMAFVVQLAREERLSAIWLTVNRYNESSLAVYEKLGFRLLRMQVADIGNGYVMDDCVLELNLAN